MNSYAEAVCAGKPMGLPEYHEEAEQWLVYFEESETPWSDEPRTTALLFPACEFFVRMDELTSSVGCRPDA